VKRLEEKRFHPELLGLFLEVLPPIERSREKDGRFGVSVSQMAEPSEKAERSARRAEVVHEQEIGALGRVALESLILFHDAGDVISLTV